jgi:ubiquinone/menaquinone biosynthesis C-methylase UbiE
MKSYFKNYLRAIDEPLPELKETLTAEFEFLKSNFEPDYEVLDVGCGVGRPANILASCCKKIIGIENDLETLTEAKERCRKIDNLEILNKDALRTSFEDNSFDLVFATYNLIGSIKKEERQTLINEMTRLVKLGGKVINITWKQNDLTTKFLEKYYPSIGINIVKIDNTKAVCKNYTFERISRAEL